LYSVLNLVCAPAPEAKTRVIAKVATRAALPKLLLDFIKLLFLKNVAGGISRVAGTTALARI
jgi:hypothetical protein